MTLMTSGVIQRQLWRPFHKTSSKMVLKGELGAGIGAYLPKVSTLKATTEVFSNEVCSDEFANFIVGQHMLRFPYCITFIKNQNQILAQYSICSWICSMFRQDVVAVSGSHMQRSFNVIVTTWDTFTSLHVTPWRRPLHLAETCCRSNYK